MKEEKKVETNDEKESGPSVHTESLLFCTACSRAQKGSLGKDCKCGNKMTSVGWLEYVSSAD